MLSPLDAKKVDASMQGSSASKPVHTIFVSTPTKDSGTASKSTDGRRPNAGSESRNTEPLVFGDQLSSLNVYNCIHNVMLVSVAFAILFSGLYTALNLQAALQVRDGLGAPSVAFLYVVFLVTAVLLPPAIMSKTSVKVTMCAGMLGFPVYITALFYPTYFTLLVGSLFFTVGWTPMWTASMVYLSRMAFIYSECMPGNVNYSFIYIFGIFFFFFESSTIIGSIITSLALTYNVTYPIVQNQSDIMSCGINYCFNVTSKAVFLVPDTMTHYTLCLIFLLSTCSAIIIIILYVAPLSSFSEGEDCDGSSQREMVLLSALGHLRRPNSLLLIPLSVWCGFQRGFIVDDYIEAYVKCAYSILHVSYVLIIKSAFTAIFSLCTKTMLEMVGRPATFTLAATLNFLAMTIMVRSPPRAEDPSFFYMPAILWGLASAIWLTLLHALYASLFYKEEEGAFCCLRVLEATGYVVSHGISSAMCLRSEVYTMKGYLIVSLLCYYIHEMMARQQRKLRLDLSAS